MSRSIVGACAAVLLLGACASPGAEPDPEPERTAPDSSALQRLAATEVCGLLGDEVLDETFGPADREREGVRRGRAPVSLSFTCTYDGDGFPTVSTDLSTVRRTESEQEAVERVFVDHTRQDGAQGDHEPVPGLGTAAAFGRDATLGAAVSAWTLGVAFTEGDERLLLTVSVTGRAEREQLTALAEEFLRNLDTTLD
ncbi:hypothetical protein [Saccharomonospora piscinae]|uniref:hypothetical protein n=1 Tax=Saccharomonospora piscinae TaxID=687388 RepID=UPI00046538D1|nr:hypothetical protein [Saccharomonospora piscinae]